MPGISEVDRWLARLENARSSCITFPSVMSDEEAVTVAREALGFFEEAANPGGQAQACFLIGWLHQRAGDPVRAVEAGRRSLEIAQDAEATRERTAAGWLITRNLVDGPTPVQDCFDEIRSLVGVGRDQNPIVMGGLARLLATSGEFEQARRVLDDARLILVERMRVRRLIAFNAWPRAFLATMTGHTSEAEREYRKVLAQFRASSEGEHRGEVAARLALVLASAGGTDEAGSLAEEARSVTPASCLPVCALGMAATARTLSIATEDSLNMAREAVALTPDAMPNQKADVMVELARVEESVGLEDQAKSSLEAAMHFYERKGNIAAIRLLERA
jgi:tetratricopeptide (TPR) repeat protein